MLSRFSDNITCVTLPYFNLNQGLLRSRARFGVLIESNGKVCE